MAGRFRRSRLVRGPHRQTVAGLVLRRGGGITAARERLATPDGDFIDLAQIAVHGVTLPEDAPHALVLHGLEASATSGYMVEQYKALAAVGFRSTGFNFRSCSGEMNRLARSYHAGDTADVMMAIDHLRRRHPDVPLVAVGFSLGGNVLLKMAGDGSPQARELSAIVAISAPHDLAACAAWLERPTSRVYALYLLRSLRAKLRMKADLLGRQLDLRTALRVASLRRYDDLVTAPLHGFADADDYYQQSSSARYLAAIRTPSLVLRAMDDPFLDPADTNQPAFATNPALSIVRTQQGGHVGFIEGSPWRPSFWAEERAADFVRSVVGN